MSKIKSIADVQVYDLAFYKACCGDLLRTEIENAGYKYAEDFTGVTTYYSHPTRGELPTTVIHLMKPITVIDREKLSQIVDNHVHPPWED